MTSLSFQGWLPYRDQWKDLYRGQKVVVEARVHDRVGAPLRLDFVVDTGAPWCILHPEFEAELSGEPAGEIRHPDRILFHGHHLEGNLVRTGLRFVCDTGASVEIETTILYPDFPDWPYPNFLGLSALERLRWAIDPHQQRRHFYVGALG